MREEITEQYTTKQKRIITNDWCEALPSLTKHKNLEIHNHVGPLVVSIYLNMGRRSVYYEPFYCVHNLCRRFPVLTATLRLEGRMIKPEQHDEMYLKEAESLVQKAYIPIDGDLSVDDIIGGYERYFENPILDSFLEYEDLALICGWTKDKNRIEYALKVVYEQLRLWPEERYFSKYGGFKRWFDMLEERTWDGDELNRIYENELLNHKLTKIPERKMIV